MSQSQFEQLVEYAGQLARQYDHKIMVDEVNDEKCVIRFFCTDEDDFCTDEDDEDVLPCVITVAGAVDGVIIYKLVTEDSKADYFATPIGLLGLLWL